jgi:hypothetical protein
LLNSILKYFTQKTSSNSVQRQQFGKLADKWSNPKVNFVPAVLSE